MEILAIIDKADADAWLAKVGKPIAEENKNHESNEEGGTI